MKSGWNDWKTPILNRKVSTWTLLNMNMHDWWNNTWFVYMLQCINIESCAQCFEWRYSTTFTEYVSMWFYCWTIWIYSIRDTHIYVWWKKINYNCLYIQQLNRQYAIRLSISNVMNTYGGVFNATTPMLEVIIMIIVVIDNKYNTSNTTHHWWCIIS